MSDSRVYKNLGDEALYRIRKELRDYPRCIEMLHVLENDSYIQNLLEQGNNVVVGRLSYNDHGITHSRIAALNSVKIIKILLEEKITPNMVSENMGTPEDSIFIVMTAAYLHDIGNAIHRKNHYTHSMMLALPFLERELGAFYGEIGKRAKIMSMILEAIYTHDEEVRAISVEGGAVKVGDGADMANGRARIPFSRGKVDIHSISALAINDVRICKGEDKPVRIEVDMECASGVFQIHEVLGKKIRTSPLEQHIEVEGLVRGPEGKSFLSKITL